MWHVEERFKVKLGGNTYINTPNLVVYKGESLFRVRRSDTDGILGIDFDVYDSTGNRAATVRKGVVVQGNENKYDIYAGADGYTVTDKESGHVICDVRRRSESPDAELEVSVRLFTPAGFLFDATPNQTNVGGMVMTGCTIQDCGAGIVID